MGLFVPRRFVVLAMIVNGRVQMACSSLVDKLLKENPGEIELRPLSKFPGSS